MCRLTFCTKIQLETIVLAEMLLKMGNKHVAAELSRAEVIRYRNVILGISGNWRSTSMVTFNLKGII